IGRTGRAGKTGRAVTFVSGREIWKMQQIIRFTKGKIRREKVPSAEEVEEKRTNQFVDTLRETLEKGDFKRQDAIIDQLLNQGHAATDIASALMHLLSEGSTRDVQAIVEEPARRDFREVRQHQHREPRDYPKYEPRPAATPRERPMRESRPRREGSEASTTSHEQGMTRLVLNIGTAHGIGPGDVVGVIAGVARLTKEDIGAINLQEKHTLVDVTDENSKTVLKKLNGIKFKGRKLGVDLAG
ncbi:MAG TPA: DbpA RNA binding domain-containing protein, partial [Chthoniobacteraceae bacterium]|nr:DbpA RNA binding domain-containing protein [Chthoniobacteraceae bacterium]